MSIKTAQKFYNVCLSGCVQSVVRKSFNSMGESLKNNQRIFVTTSCNLSAGIKPAISKWKLLINT